MGWVGKYWSLLWSLEELVRPTVNTQLTQQTFTITTPVPCLKALNVAM
jgi:hypothetical protein